MTGREKVSGEEHEIYPRCRPRPVRRKSECAVLERIGVTECFAASK